MNLPQPFVAVPVTFETLNLEDLKRVLYGGNISGANSTQQKTVYFYYGGTADTSLLFSTPIQAKAFFDKVNRYLSHSLGVLYDLKVPSMSITNVSPSSIYQSIPTTVTLTGSNFSATGKVTVDGEVYPITIVDATHATITVQQLSTAGPMTAEYSDDEGGYTTFTITWVAPTLVILPDEPYLNHGVNWDLDHFPYYYIPSWTLEYDDGSGFVAISQGPPPNPPPAWPLAAGDYRVIGTDNSANPLTDYSNVVTIS